MGPGRAEGEEDAEEAGARAGAGAGAEVEWERELRGLGGAGGVGSEEEVSIEALYKPTQAALDGLPPPFLTPSSLTHSLTHSRTDSHTPFSSQSLFPCLDTPSYRHPLSPFPLPSSFSTLHSTLFMAFLPPLSSLLIPSSFLLSTPAPRSTPHPCLLASLVLVASRSN
eukprot:2661262-Rhodomonas_salina.1